MKEPKHPVSVAILECAIFYLVLTGMATVPFNWIMGDPWIGANILWVALAVTPLTGWMTWSLWKDMRK
ncbi:hypothetical protein NKH72_21670 [Mesorhizobium sp. M0955]|uniref:hypothetical protein n=1 Tax=Mesorhizobium sp. M0955 TaxID=2957033 RepID=UPI00333A1900